MIGRVSALIQDTLPVSVIVENMVGDAVAILSANAVKIKTKL